MTVPTPLSRLRSDRWSSIPTSPGVYWWYFPAAEIALLRVPEFCDATTLQLRTSPDGKLCLYHGLAKNLAQRIAWHAAQPLAPSALRSGFLSTFRFTLLALNGFDYRVGSAEIDAYFDALSVSWQASTSRDEAESIERNELGGAYHYPLNIQGNRRPELRLFTRHVRATRSAYKRRFLAL